MPDSEGEAKKVNKRKFLKIVEESQNQPEEIYNRLSSIGELADDFSINQIKINRDF